MENINFAELNWFDVSVLLTVFASTLFAFFRGFIKAGFSLFTWVAAGVVTAFVYPKVFGFLDGKIINDTAKTMLSAAGVFILSFIAIAIVNSKIINALGAQRGGIVDRTLGFAFGLLRGALIVCLFFYSISLTSSMLQFGDPERPGPKWFTEAKTYTLLEVTTNSILAVLPESVPQRMVEYIDDVKDASIGIIGNEGLGAGGSGLPRALNNNERKIMQDVISAIPREDLLEVYQKYEGSASDLSELEKMSIFRDILDKYQESTLNKKIDSGQEVTTEQLEALDKALYGERETKPDIPVEEGTGYKEMNIKQLERLVDSVDEGE
jgi:membrane protein required for colicin V production